MGYNFCKKCGAVGRMPDPQRKWWQFWKTVPCDACGGGGFAKPPGWPDCAEMERLRPNPPPPPPSPPPPATHADCLCCGGYQPKGEPVDLSQIDWPTTDDVIGDVCEHDFPERQNFCTHIGHETLGAHSRHYVCRKCGALKTVRLGSGKTTISSAMQAMQGIYSWPVIREPHQCRAGWKGQVVADIPSSDRLELSDKR